MRLIYCVAAMFIAATLSAQGAGLDLWYRRGGYTFVHIVQARHWLASRRHLVIRDTQVSAAAVQVLYYQRMGGTVCFFPKRLNVAPSLKFHLSASRGVYRNDIANYIGAENAAKIGKLSAGSFKSFHPTVFGIKAC